MVDEPGSGEMTSIWGMVESLFKRLKLHFIRRIQDSGRINWQLLYIALAEKFAQRWTQEQRGKRPDIPEERRLTPDIKRRFVLAYEKSFS